MMMEPERKRQRFSDNWSDDSTELDRRGGPDGTRRRPGMYKPKEEVKPVTIGAFEFCVFHKYEEQSIVVDCSANMEPTKVWFLPYADMDECQTSKDKDDFFRIKYSEDHSRNTEGVDVTPSWFSTSRIPHSVNRQDLETVMSMFRDMSACLRWRRSRRPEEVRWDSIAERRLGHDELIINMFRKDPWLVSTFASGRFLRAFKKGMSNSAGKSALTAILLLAGQLVYGKESIYREEIDCFSVGSSDPKERFPVKQATPEFLNESPQQLHRLSAPSVLPDMALGDTASVWARSSRKKSDSAKSSNTCKKGVYADLHFMSGKKPNWPHFVFVGEVKKGHEELSGAATYQLLKEMMGPMMRQSLVFGILMNATKATLCTMQQNFAQKTINVSFEYYDFLSNKDFNFSQFEIMFRDIMHAMNFIQDNVEEIDRGF